MNQLPDDRFTRELLSGSPQIADKIPAQPPAEVVAPPAEQPAPDPQSTPQPMPQPPDGGKRRRIVNIVSIAIAAVAVVAALIVVLPRLLGGGSGTLPTSSSSTQGSSSGASASTSSASAGGSTSHAPLTDEPGEYPQPGERFTTADGDWVEFIDDEVCVLSVDGIEVELYYGPYTDDRGTALTFGPKTLLQGDTYERHRRFAAGAAWVRAGGLWWRMTDFYRP